MTAFVPAADVGVLDSPEEVLTTLRSDGKRKWMYPSESRGRFWRRRQILGWALIALFVALPIVKIKGKPAVLLDVAAREFTLFGTTFYPTDTLFLMLFGISALVSIALLTALLGRVWCGWGCPQTVYLEFLFRPIERLIEGKENVRQRRDARKDLTWDKAWRKGAKWTVYLAISAALAHVFVSYFVGWSDLIRWMTGPPTEHWGYFLLMAGTTALVAFDFGVFREQMCTIACPYARFQSVLMDEESMIVSYDPTRGEPRGRGKSRMTKDGQPLGDCVDCFACVRTCPTGIDIRDGIQMECIACTQCIDACDSIMDKTGQFTLGIDNTFLVVSINGDATVKTATKALNIVIPAITFTHVAATWDGSQIKLYRNGVYMGSVAYSNALAAGTSDIMVGQLGS
ncbi:MAG TPA: cytochrome c oxidase accessory protein CcoG, partial [Bacteroidetes bacterium]|nr:cytochrome c oxidase accessory protein CcoG [Bacteroidota bacterium]